MDIIEKFISLLIECTDNNIGSTREELSKYLLNSDMLQEYIYEWKYPPILCIDTHIIKIIRKIVLKKNFYMINYQDPEELLDLHGEVLVYFWKMRGEPLKKKWELLRYENNEFYKFFYDRIKDLIREKHRSRGSNIQVANYKSLPLIDGTLETCETCEDLLEVENKILVESCMNFLKNNLPNFDKYFMELFVLIYTKDIPQAEISKRLNISAVEVTRRKHKIEFWLKQFKDFIQ